MCTANISPMSDHENDRNLSNMGTTKSEQYPLKLKWPGLQIYRKWSNPHSGCMATSNTDPWAFFQKKILGEIHSHPTTTIIGTTTITERSPVVTKVEDRPFFVDHKDDSIDRVTHKRFDKWIQKKGFAVNLYKLEI